MSAPCCPHCEARRITIEALTDELRRLEDRVGTLERAVVDRTAQATLLGKQGGKARKAALTIDERKAIARHAAFARWRKNQ